MELDIITREEFDVLETDVEENKRDLEDRLESMEYDIQRIDESHVDKYEHESTRDDIHENFEALLCFLIHRGIVPDDVTELNDLYKVEERECNAEDDANRSQDVDDTDTAPPQNFCDDVEAMQDFYRYGKSTFLSLHEEYTETNYAFTVGRLEKLLGRG